MKQTCIQHPPGHNFVVIRSWAVTACDGDTTAAALMSFFEYWHNVKVAYAAQGESANRISRNWGADETADTSLYQWHTSEDCERGIQGIATKKTISKAVALLIQKGFLSVHKNPDPKKCFDQTKHFLFHPDKVNEWIGQNLPNAAGKNAPSSGKNAQSYKDAHAPHYKDTNNERVCDFVNSQTNEPNNESSLLAKILSVTGKAIQWEIGSVGRDREKYRALAAELEASGFGVDYLNRFMDGWPKHWAGQKVNGAPPTIDDVTKFHAQICGMAAPTILPPGMVSMEEGTRRMMDADEEKLRVALERAAKLKGVQ